MQIAERVLNTPWVFNSLRSVIDPGQVACLRRMLARVPHVSLLDLGCGIGSLCDMTDEDYTGVDNTASYIDYASRHYATANRRFLVDDAFALDQAFADDAKLGAYDLVSLINVIHHFSDDEVRRVLAGLSAIAPARVIIVDVALERAGWLFHRLFGPLDRGAHFRTTDAQRILLESAGFRVEWVDGYVTGPRIYPHSVLCAKSPYVRG